MVGQLAWGVATFRSCPEEADALRKVRGRAPAAWLARCNTSASTRVLCWREARRALGVTASGSATHGGALNQHTAPLNRDAHQDIARARRDLAARGFKSPQQAVT
jgi:hypothetical protein